MARLVPNRIQPVKTVLKRVLYPVLRAFAPMLLLRAELSTERLPRPSDEPRGYAPGPDPDRVLLLGSGPAMGYGVLSHELALPGHLARQISAITGRGLTVDVVADGDTIMQTTVDSLGTVNLARYDAIVLTVGVNDALRNTPVREWRRQLTEVLDYTTSRMQSDGHTFLLAIQPIRTIRAFNNLTGLFPELHGRLLNREAIKICAALPRVSFIPFEPRTEATERYRSSSAYGKWAELIVPSIVEALQQASRVETQLSTEESRQGAVDALLILDTEPEARFDRIAEFARQLFNTESSVISFLDRDREWMKTRVGFDHQEAPRGTLLIEHVIRQAETFVIEDATKDDRFIDSLFVTGPPHLRFYAGHPILSRKGERVGVISIFDSKARSFSMADSKFLRDLAHLVERELRLGNP